MVSTPKWLLDSTKSIQLSTSYLCEVVVLALAARVVHPPVEADPAVHRPLAQRRVRLEGNSVDLFLTDIFTQKLVEDVAQEM